MYIMYYIHLRIKRSLYIYNIMVLISLGFKISVFLPIYGRLMSQLILSRPTTYLR